MCNVQGIQNLEQKVQHHLCIPSVIRDYINCNVVIALSLLGLPSLMKAAACGTWLGDLITALMVSDMMLQDDLYPHWANRVRAFWRRHNVARILVFWVGSIVATVLVVTLIVSDLISWDRLNRGFVATTGEGMSQTCTVSSWRVRRQSGR